MASEAMPAPKVERGTQRVDRDCFYGWAGNDVLGVYRSGPIRPSEAEARQDAKRHADNIERLGMEAPW